MGSTVEASSEFSLASLDLESLPGVIDAIGRLFIVVWDRSPSLVWFIVIMLILLPFFRAFLKRNIAPTVYSNNAAENAAWERTGIQATRPLQDDKWAGASNDD